MYMRKVWSMDVQLDQHVGSHCQRGVSSKILREPDTSCNKKGKADSSENWKIISFVVELINIVVATFSTGADYKCIQFNNVVESENDIPYGYGFFHFVFAIRFHVFWHVVSRLGHTSCIRKFDSLHLTSGGVWMSVGPASANKGLAVIFFVAIVLSRIFGTG
ncbi:unnamed protein product [Miscanthus lutarioriparius]|uniref:Uncharacterized protein n=1 Tax=Miscanthus lutarioriparius TaxID=422564 RepID=A0A811RF64_9POAL|nr:unnamed protein product [Miscanthus lutarioriparius]